MNEDIMTDMRRARRSKRTGWQRDRQIARARKQAEQKAALVADIERILDPAPWDRWNR